MRSRPCFEISECNEEKTVRAHLTGVIKLGGAGGLQGNTGPVPGGKEIALCILQCVIYAQTLCQH